ncbi:MAG TPA: AsnC family transcriptional regulator [Cytophagales bacterium]|nr:AsnC family transcriptional regulator [Cytophagales bacterium]
MNLKLDKIDRKILEILQLDAKITNAQLSKEIGLSPAPTLERVKKLETSGLIKSYHAQLDTQMIGLGVSIYILISLSSHKMNQINSFVEKIKKLPEVIECHHITGSGDFLLKVLTSDIPSYQKLILDKLSQIEEIGNMQSMVVLANYKQSRVIPIPA